jgi:hypothetical protein
MGMTDNSLSFWISERQQGEFNKPLFFFTVPQFGQTLVLRSVSPFINIYTRIIPINGEKKKHSNVVYTAPLNACPLLSPYKAPRSGLSNKKIIPLHDSNPLPR